MKVLTREQIREADAFTIKNEPILSINLMERASRTFTNYLIKHFRISGTVYVFCGQGNNGGDGLAVARLLLEKNFKVVVYILKVESQNSDDFTINFRRLNEKYKNVIYEISNADFTFKPDPEDIVIDAMWGTGLTRPIEGFAGKVIQEINESLATIVAIDIPSGTFCDAFNYHHNKIKAAFTISFQVPKLAFFIPENSPYIGHWRVIDIGLDQSFIDNINNKYHYLEKIDIRSRIIPRGKFDHKGKFGHARLVSGSFGKMGAAVLGARACLRSGVGLLTVNIPKSGYSILQTSVPEAMVVTDSNEEIVTEITDNSAISANGIGPGIGTSNLTEKALIKFLSETTKPLVIDADGINLLSKNPDYLKMLPPRTILTPHIGEFERLAEKHSDHFFRIEKALELALKYDIVIVIKGHYSVIVSPEGKVYFNSTGNSGMAKGGSGDVLTGIVLAFLAQGYNAVDAAIIAVYLHGLAGDIALYNNNEFSIIASDLIDCLPYAFSEIFKLKTVEKK